MDAHEEPSEWRCDFCGAGPFTYDAGPGGWDEHWRSCEKNPRPLESRATVGHPQTFPADQMNEIVEVKPLPDDDGLDEEAVQAIALALAELSLRRPGWTDHLRDIAQHYDAALLFEQFRASSAGTVPEAPDSPLVSRVEELTREVMRLKNKCANYATYANHLEGCKDFVVPRGRCDCGLLEVLSDVNVGLELPSPGAVR